MLACLVDIFQEDIDGIYLYGSIARGEASINASDMDLTLVFKVPLGEAKRQELEKLRIRLEERHPEFLKIDFDIGCVANILDEQSKYSWGYWIKHCCKCLWGRDLSLQLPLLKPSKAIALALNADFGEVIQGYVEKLKHESDGKGIRRLKREASRKIIRSTSVLAENRTDFWPIRLEDYVDSFCSNFPHKRSELEYFLKQARDADLEASSFIQSIRAFSEWLEHQTERIGL